MSLRKSFAVLSATLLRRGAVVSLNDNLNALKLPARRFSEEVYNDEQGTSHPNEPPSEDAKCVTLSLTLKDSILCITFFFRGQSQPQGDLYQSQPQGDLYAGIALGTFSEEINKVLLGPLKPEDVEIKPDGNVSQILFGQEQSSTIKLT